MITGVQCCEHGEPVGLGDTGLQIRHAGTGEPCDGVTFEITHTETRRFTASLLERQRVLEPTKAQAGSAA